jgi:hypothetical protein
METAAAWREFAKLRRLAPRVLDETLGIPRGCTGRSIVDIYCRPWPGTSPPQCGHLTGYGPRRLIRSGLDLELLLRDVALCGLPPPRHGNRGIAPRDSRQGNETQDDGSRHR